MRYTEHYKALIEKAKNQTVPDGTYTEKHHITPRCLGGKDTKENLVRLTPEQHYVAHQLLVKMYPGNEKLIYALNKMTQGRASNKRYGWIKRCWSEVCKKRTGEKNGSYGRSWYHNPETGEAGKFAEPPQGWVKGRTPVKNRCLTCEKVLENTNASYCYKHRIEENKKQSRKTDEYYLELYNEFLKGNYKSISDFIRKKNINLSVQSISNNWQRLVRGYKKQQGKPKHLSSNG